MNQSVEDYLKNGGKVESLNYHAPKWSKQKVGEKYTVYGLGAKKARNGFNKGAPCSPSPVA